MYLNDAKYFLFAAISFSKPRRFDAIHSVPERIYNSHYGNGVPTLFSVYLLASSSWRLNIAKNPIDVIQAVSCTWSVLDFCKIK